MHAKSSNLQISTVAFPAPRSYGSVASSFEKVDGRQESRERWYSSFVISKICDVNLTSDSLANLGI